MTLPTNEILLGDCRELVKLIPDGSIDLIFTDPPYPKEYLYCYSWLAQETPRILKDTGILLMYVGPYWKDEVMQRIRPYMNYYFDFILLDKGDSPMIWPRKTIARYKSLLAYTKMTADNILPRYNILSLWEGGGQDKRYHTWGQDESSARYYIDCFSKRGDLVFDPFCGGGTTAAVCKTIGRNFITCDIDAQAVETARARVSNHQTIMDLSANLQVVMPLSDEVQP